MDLLLRNRESNRRIDDLEVPTGPKKLIHTLNHRIRNAIRYHHKSGKRKIWSGEGRGEWIRRSTIATMRKSRRARVLINDGLEEQKRKLSVKELWREMMKEMRIKEEEKIVNW